MSKSPELVKGVAPSAKESSSEAAATNDKKAEEPKDGGIDFDGLSQRAARVPLDANNYSGLAVKSDALIYGIYPAPYYGRQASTKLRCDSESSRTRSCGESRAERTARFAR